MKSPRSTCSNERQPREVELARMREPCRSRPLSTAPGCCSTSIKIAMRMRTAAMRAGEGSREPGWGGGGARLAIGGSSAGEMTGLAQSTSI